MQQKTTKQEKIILSIMAKIIYQKRKEAKKSQRLIAFENHIQKSMFSRFEPANNQPLLFSAWKIAESLGLKFSEFIILIEKELPEDFTLIEI